MPPPTGLGAANGLWRRAASNAPYHTWREAAAGREEPGQVAEHPRRHEGPEPAAGRGETGPTTGAPYGAMNRVHRSSTSGGAASRDRGGAGRTEADNEARCSGNGGRVLLVARAARRQANGNVEPGSRNRTSRRCNESARLMLQHRASHTLEPDGRTPRPDAPAAARISGPRTAHKKGRTRVRPQSGQALAGRIEHWQVPANVHRTFSRSQKKPRSSPSTNRAGCSTHRPCRPSRRPGRTWWASGPA